MDQLLLVIVQNWTQLLCWAQRKANYYQNLIGVLRWAIELGQIDIHIEIALLSSYLAASCVGHLD